MVVVIIHKNYHYARFVGKGLGLQALRDIPPLYRILVEGWLTMEDVVGHSNFAEVVPEGATTSVKFDMNGIAGGTGPAVGLRLSRANHNCDGNASCATDEDANVLILFSNWEIKAGEEICISYSSDLTTLPNHLSKKTGGPQRDIDCPEDCFCYDPKLQELIDKCFMLNLKYERSIQLSRPADGVEALEEVIQLMLEAKCTQNMIRLVWSWILEAAERDPMLNPIGLKYAELIRDLNAKMYHPSMKYVDDSPTTVERLKMGNCQ